MASEENTISPEKLHQRQRELRERKYSFIELVMQVKKKLYKEEMARDRKVRERNGHSN